MLLYYERGIIVIKVCEHCIVILLIFRLQTGLSIGVRINDWMDISCPRLDESPGGPDYVGGGEHRGRRGNGFYLTIYNVTKEKFENCTTESEYFKLTILIYYLRFWDI